MTQTPRAAVLLVDADEPARARVAAMLSDAGFLVEAHPDYRGALAVLDSGAPLACMITALVLPKGTPHGLALGNMAALRRPGLPLVFIADGPEEARWVDARWSSDVLMRPVEDGALLQALARVVEAGRLHSP